MSLQSEGLSLYEAARAIGVSFAVEAIPRDAYASANGLNFHYLEWGTPGGKTVLLLHGAGQQAHSWDFISLALCEEYHVLALDARGHGDSQWSADGDYSMDAHQSDLDAVVEAIGIAPFILVGHSMGGRNAFAYASRNPEAVDALVIVDTGPTGRPQGQDRIRRFRELPDELDSYQEFASRIQSYTGRTTEQVLGSLKYSIRERDDGKWTWKYDPLLRSPGFQPQIWPEAKLWDCLAQVRCPTLLVRGSDSDVLSPEVIERMLEVVPRIQGSVVEKAGHLVPGDNPTGFLEVIRDFLRRA